MRRSALPFILLGLAFVAVAAWSWTWPDHPLIPDEAIAKTMADNVAANRTPFAKEPITAYRDGTFGRDRYGNAYANHSIVRPPTSIGAAYEQGLLGPKAGRAATLALGTAALAFLAWRIAGSWAALFAGLAYLVHPATLYFSQSYFSNSGGTAWFLASLALLEAGRRRPWLVRLSVLAGALAVIFRAEYAMGLVVLALIAWIVLEESASLIAYYSTLALALLALANFDILLPGLTNEQLFKHGLPIAGLLADPRLFIDVIVGAHSTGRPPEWAVFSMNARDYFPLFFPLVSILAVTGLFARVPNRRSTWVYVPLAAQALIQGYATLPSLAGFDFSNVSWLESSIVRYFLLAYALTALLAGIALGLLVERLSSLDGDARSTARLARLRLASPSRFAVSLRRLASPSRVAVSLRARATPLLAVALAALVASASIAGAWNAEHGVPWANTRRAWFNDIDAAAAKLGPDAVFIGYTPSKVIYSRPIFDPVNVGSDPTYATFVALDLMAGGHRVFALEPWFWTDAGDVETMVVAAGHSYWTDTDVVVNCACGEFARFYELHATNATFLNVTRVSPDALRGTPVGGATTNGTTFFFPERSLQIRMGLAETRGVTVTLRVIGHSNATYEAGYWTLPFSQPRNAHRLATWTGNEGLAPRVVTFHIDATEVANGAFFVRGPPGLVVSAVEATES